MARLIACLLLFAIPGVSQTRIPLEDRLWVASKIYASIPVYFAHWQAAGTIDLDAAYKKYLATAIGAETRWDFDLATLEFVAMLKNGHTVFEDDFLQRAGGRPLGFAADPVNGRWVVRESYLDSLKVGDVIERIDNQSMDDFFAAKRRYIAASSERSAQHVFFYHKHLFPQRFMLHLASGDDVAIDRFKDELHFPAAATSEARWMREPEIAYLRIPSFDGARFENAALAALEQHKSARAIVFDVRGNGGGSTPSRLLQALIDRPYRNWGQTMALHFSYFQAYTKVAASLPPGEMSEQQKGYSNAFAEYFAAPQMVAPGAVIPPSNPLYQGKLLVLTDGSCASACEDFVMPLKYSGRATIIGARTFGSSGQPYIYNFGNGMSIHISSVRMHFPDGSEFEGAGIRPDIEMDPTPAELRAGRDPVLARALELAAQP